MDPRLVRKSVQILKTDPGARLGGGGLGGGARLGGGSRWKGKKGRWGALQGGDPHIYTESYLVTFQMEL